LIRVAGEEKREKRRKAEKMAKKEPTLRIVDAHAVTVYVRV